MNKLLTEQSLCYLVDQWWDEIHSGRPFKYADEMEFSDEHMAEFVMWLIENGYLKQV